MGTRRLAPIAPDSRFTIHDSRLTIQDSRFTIHDSRFTIAIWRRWMRGNAEVIAQLNQALKEELTAINQYFLHAEMCHNWGYHRIGAYIKKQSIDEMQHAEKLIE